MENIAIKTKDGHEYQFIKTKRDLNGNPRYLINFIDLGLANFQHSNQTKNCGLRLYRGKSFSGCFILQSYNLQNDAENFAKNGLHKIKHIAKVN